MRSSSFLFFNNVITANAPDVLDLNEEECWSTSHFESGLDRTWPTEDQITNSFIWNNTFNGRPMDINDIDIVDCARDIIRDNYEFFMHAPESSGGRSYYSGRPGAAGNDNDGTLVWMPSGANAYYPYTPYTYPHPLTLVGDAPLNPTGLTATEPSQ